MRANDKNFIITPYAEYNRLDSSTIKIKEPDHLFDVDPANRRSNKRPYVDKDAITLSVEATQTPMEIPSDSTEKSFQTTKSANDMSSDNKISPTIEQLIEQKEKTRGVKRQKLFDYDDEW